MKSFTPIWTVLFLLFSLAAQAHDTWVQTNTNVIRAGDILHIDLMLGNHGNEHRDFKLAGKLDIAAATLQLYSPDGKKYDLKDRLLDTGYTPQEGYWTARFAPTTPGLYMVAHTYDKVMSYAPERAVKSSKTFFVVSKSLDRVPEKNLGFNRVLGHPLELVPVINPVTPMGPGTPLTFRLLYKGKPLPKTNVAFIPRGVVLKEGTDAQYERVTDAQGQVKFTPTEANYYLIVAHHTEPEEGGTDYKFTKYGATLTLYVPQICPCCGG